MSKELYHVSEYSVRELTKLLLQVLTPDELRTYYSKNRGRPCGQARDYRE